ncbi:MAG TPA: TIGR02281 family clan AA aspartic protease [Usitatibacter sp.]|nr:TIGR02281 family clan AA aspartic protease [Usitatibacter sp.]
MKGPFLAAALALAAAPAWATDVNVIGLFPGKALVVIDRGAPRTLAVGQRTPEGVLLLSADSRSATLEIDGRRETLEMGRHFETGSQSAAAARVTLPPDSRGHYMTEGQVNGSAVRFLVDTGATFVTLPASEAQRLHVDLSRGTRGVSQTANGAVPVQRVLLDTVKVGDITLYNVEAVVNEGGDMGMALLGMSFLNRTQMRADGPNLVLEKRY